MSKKNDKVITELMSSPIIKSLGIRQDVVENILDTYHDIVLKQLVAAGHIELSNGMNLEVVKLTNRVHVLRGVSYQNTRKYKLKLTMDEDLYAKVEKYYETLLRDIE